MELGPWASVERRDTWDMVWANDDPNQVRTQGKAETQWREAQSSATFIASHTP